MKHSEMLDRLERDCERFADPERARTLMIQGAALMPCTLPDVAEEAFRVALEFQRGGSSEAELERVRVACWEHLGPRDREFQDANVGAMRAVICALFPVIEDPFDYLTDFLDFAETAGVPSVELSGLLRSVYEDTA